MRRAGQGRIAAAACAALLACVALLAPAWADDGADAEAGRIARRDRALIEARLMQIPAQVPGTPDLHAIAVAGDGDEHVFRNEALYFEELATVRYGAAGRTLALVNHPRSLDGDPRPLATLENLRAALQGIGARMDPEEDLLLLFLTTHGSRDHALSMRLEGHVDAGLRPAELREALDASGIRHRLLIVSACFSGGFIPALADPSTLVITAARHDRPSFGCGDSGSATWFGRALLVEGLNRDEGLVGAFEYARRQVARRETMEDVAPSYPQISIGADIATRLDAWEASLARGPRLPYPHPL